MLAPFRNALREGGIPEQQVQHKIGAEWASLDEEYVPSTVSYSFANAVAEVLGNPTLGYQIGATTPFPKLVNLEVLRPSGAMLVEYLTALVVDAPRLTNQANYDLKIDGQFAVLSQHRFFTPPVIPEQPDGFFAGMMLRLVQGCARGHWAPDEFRVRVSSARAIPDWALPRNSITQSRKADVQFRFPAAWLLLSGDPEADITSLGGTHYSGGIEVMVTKLVEDHLHDATLGLEQIASVLSMPKRSLQRQLLASGVGFREIVRSTKERLAKRLLNDKQHSIQEVGEAIGFSEPASFTRAFRQWTGKTPSEFRRNASPE